MDELIKKSANIKRVQTYNLPGTIDLIFEVGKQLALRASHSGIRVILKSSHGHAQIYMSAKDLDINSRSVKELANAIREFINCAVNLPLVAGYRAYFSGRGEV